MASTFRIRSIWNSFPPSLLQTTWSFATCRFTKNSKADCMAWLMGRASWLGCKTHVEIQQSAPFGIYLKLILPFKRMWYIQNAFFWWQQPLVMFLHTQQTPHGIKHNTTLERENKNHRILIINFWVPEKIQHGGVSKPLSSVGFLFLKTFLHPNFPPFKGEGSKHEGHSYCSTCPGYYETTWFLSPLSIHPGVFCWLLWDEEISPRPCGISNGSANLNLGQLDGHLTATWIGGQNGMLKTIN